MSTVYWGPPESLTATEVPEKRATMPVPDQASGFITAVPSDEDGRDTVLKPRVFRTAVAYRLGVPLLREEIACPLCEQHINKYGDHATCCTKAGDIIVRHNTLRNLVDGIASDGLLSPVLEKKGILGTTSGRRPGDVTIPIWADGKGLAIDVAVTSPLAPSSVRLVSPCEEYALRQKHGKYDVSFQDTPFLFCAMVWETLGAINEEGEDVIRQIFRFAAKRLGREFSSFCGRAWARVSCCLQRSVAQAILNRIDGHSFRDPVVPSSSPCVLPQVPEVVPPVPPPSLTSFVSVPSEFPPLSVPSFTPVVRFVPSVVPPEESRVFVPSHPASRESESKEDSKKMRGGKGVGKGRRYTSFLLPLSDVSLRDTERASTFVCGNVLRPCLDGGSLLLPPSVR